MHNNLSKNICCDAKTILIVQKKSSCKLSKRQKATLSGLGLGRIGSSSILSSTPEVLGMLKKISHVVDFSFKIEENFNK